jgi:hypothetical protein
MKIKIWPDDASMLEMNGWLEMNDWIAELRDDADAEPAGDGGAGPAGDGRAGPAAHGGAGPAGNGRAWPAADGRAGPAGNGRAWPAADGRARPAGSRVARHGTAADALPATRLETSLEISPRVEITERAAIGDRLRIPIAWCEMGACISHHDDPAALGEADIRARAISVGWRVDALGRLACPKCQQSGAGFWSSHPVALWDRDTAIARAFLMAAAMRNLGPTISASGRRRA